MEVPVSPPEELLREGVASDMCRDCTSAGGPVTSDILEELGERAICVGTAINFWVLPKK